MKDPGYGAGSGAGWSGKAFFDRSTGEKLDCSDEESAPLDASRLVRVEGDLSWYKAPPHKFIWNVSLPVPKFVPGPYYKPANKTTSD